MVRICKVAFCRGERRSEMTGLDKDIFRATRELTTLLN
jgi:hypothetical protein